MLVLTRKVGEEIVINDDIRIRVIGVRGNRIRLGIEADRRVSVMRGELLAGDRSAEREPALAVVGGN
jgi:carbon storage regulator